MVRILETDCHCPDRKVIEEAVRVLKNGGVVVAATDTLYGLLADPFNVSALDQVYTIKERPRDKPLPLLLGESHHALKIIEPSSLFWRLALRYWPGPLTLVARAKDSLPSHLSRWDKIGVRLPDCPLTRILAKELGGVIVGTSANKSGRESPVTVYESVSQLGELVDLYIDSGPTYRRAPSTVVDTTGGKPIVYREGYITREELEETLGLA
ncbi:MAG: threonylcarbamoyl-AMP synthase [Desulfurococcales archaeon]|nr:threonylcarbamoyl-AMP synthase [Desulfurococcales archaeon]